jgi:hypothetical protein
MLGSTSSDLVLEGLPPLVLSSYFDISVMNSARHTIVLDSRRCCDIGAGRSQFSRQHGLNKANAGGHLLRFVYRNLPATIATLNSAGAPLAAFGSPPALSLLGHLRGLAAIARL